MNKEFTRMQKLAGILTEGFMGQFYAPEYLEQKYGKEMASRISAEVDEMDENSYDRFTAFTSAEEVEDYISDIKDMLNLTEVMDERSMDSQKGKMKKSEFKKKLKEAILAERALKEAKKGKKEEEDTEEEDVDIDLGTDGEDIDLNLDSEEGVGDVKVDMNMDNTGDVDAGSSESKKAFSELTDAYRAAKELGDEKLIRQIANTITYFNKNIILSQG
jgi:hypothetical protein